MLCSAWGDFGVKSSLKTGDAATKAQCNGVVSGLLDLGARFWCEPRVSGGFAGCLPSHYRSTCSSSHPRSQRPSVSTASGCHDGRSPGCLQATGTHPNRPYQATTVTIPAAESCILQVCQFACFFGAAQSPLKAPKRSCERLQGLPLPRCSRCALDSIDCKAGIGAAVLGLGSLVVL